MAPRNHNSGGWFNLIVALFQVPGREILPVRHNIAGITPNEHSSSNAGDHVIVGEIVSTVTISVGNLTITLVCK